MRRTARLFAPGLLLAAFVCARLEAQAPALVPVDDVDAATALLPAGILRTQPEFFGDYAHVWALEDGTQVLQFYGDFSAQVGERRVRSREAVVWMQKSVWQKTVYYHFELFLNGEAEVRDSADTLTTAPLLFVTFNTVDPPAVEADVHTVESSADTKLYQEAAKTRQAMADRAATQPQDLQAVQPGARITVPKQPKVRPLVRHTAKDRMIDRKEGIITATGDVYVSQGLEDSGEFLEIRADAAVLFLAKRQPKQAKPAGTGTSTAPGEEPFPTETPEDIKPESTGTLGMSAGMEADVTGVYLRGNVVLTRGERMIRASELYYDFENDRALILDAVMKAMAPERNVPIYVRAMEVRQLSTTEYFARKAMISTSEFHTPHVHIGAERVYLTDTTARDPTGRITSIEAGQFRVYDATLNVEGVPIAYWPYGAGDFTRSETAIQSMRFAYDDDFGATFQSKWYLFNLLGLEKPQGVDAILRHDYFSERGPAIGLDVDYATENNYGLIRTYYIHDHGEDNLGPYRDSDPGTENRGRYTIRHREFLPKGWELTLEASWISDPNFMDEYFRAEFEEGKQQETLLYLKKQQDNWAFTTLAQWRILNFLTQTEHFPDLAFNWIGQPIAEIASYYNESHLGFARYKPDNRRIFDNGSDITFRADTRNEIDLPIKLGNTNIVPFAMGRTGYWDNSPAEGSLDRLFGMLGVRMGTQFWRVYDQIESKLLDISGIRHVIKPEATGWLSASNQDSRDLYPFDEGIESINDFYGSSLALRQAWQTRRGGPGQWRNVDWITFDVELNLFGNQPKYEQSIGRFYDSRPENSIARNHVRTDFMYRISDTTAILSETNFDLSEGSMDLLDISYAVERTPRFSYFVGYRRIGDTDSNLIGGGANYEINFKHRVAVRTYYDLNRGETEEFDISLIRRFPRWYAALTFGLDNIENNVNVGVSIWPEGAPQAVIGSHRFTSLSESTGIRPED